MSRPHGRMRTTCSSLIRTKLAAAWPGSARSGDPDGGEKTEEKEEGGRRVPRPRRQTGRRARGATRRAEGGHYDRRRRRDGTGGVPGPAGRELADPRGAAAREG